MPITAIIGSKSDHQQVWLEVEPPIDNEIFARFKEQSSFAFDMAFQDGKIVIQKFPFPHFEAQHVATLNAVLENATANVTNERQQKTNNHRATMEQIATKANLPLKWD